ncbi:hypothetical protein [Mycobacterium montefiorense]|uniref:Uncharacterized protein n=1 Tax=Mycobacterium montefiorense TaxID=154654 RepID=A0AA37UX73_9MYCO|nr:hypothetical protein [Mycobacterium montefiorense]GBG36724.1 hypothetical protein MmonteBS_10960 [Mycobacterium montefiorense]GKU37484.1 hypothetical protein NJB14191_48300 [Mycobacterium montefiorense]GKU42648.1 hypothetical protein NJB14192_46310 [Mycobacterium montefiorense]GKU48674.1 hypothetical protein NJB14194_52890 [Mycobacterium montefiorense]GKU50699.1 hypothetical protein NJB14195_19450 [Mycobacterium montefiorense]
MASQEGSRWDVSIKSNAICLERISADEDQVSEDSLAAEEARELAGLLTKFADKLDESGDSDNSDGSDDKDESADKSDNSED